MPVPQAQHGSELFPGMNKKDRTNRFHLDVRTAAPDDKRQAHSMLPDYGETAAYTGANKAGDRFKRMMISLEWVEKSLKETISADPARQRQQRLELDARTETLINNSLEYYKAHTFAISKKARRKKRLAKRLYSTASAQHAVIRQMLEATDFTAYAGKMSYGDAILETKSGFSLRGRANVPEIEKTTGLNMPVVKLGQVDDRLMHQTALNRQTLRGTEDQNYSGVGASMSKMLRMPNLKGQQGVEDTANQLEDGKTYYFKRNLGDISAKIEDEIGDVKFLEAIPYEEALRIVREKEPELAIPENPNVRQREGVRIRAAKYDRRIDDVLPEQRATYLAEFDRVSNGLLKPQFDWDFRLYTDNAIKQMNADLANKRHLFTPEYLERRKAAQARVKQKRIAKVRTLPIEYSRIENMPVLENAPEQGSEIEKAIFSVRNIKRKSANTAKKDVAYYKIDQLLGLNIVPKTILAEDAHGRMGRLMEQFKGKEAVDFIEDQYTQDHEAAREKFRSDRHFYKRISEMHLLDLICGQGDRHGKNFTIYEKDEGGFDIQAFDNDLAFGTKNKGFDGMVKSGGFSKFIPQEMAEKILSLSIGTIKGAVGGLLNEEEYEAMDARLQEVQKAIRQRKDEGGLLSDTQWNSLSLDQIEEFLWEGRATTGISIELLQANLRSDIATNKNKPYRDIVKRGNATTANGFDVDYDNLGDSIVNWISSQERGRLPRVDLQTEPVDTEAKRKETSRFRIENIRINEADEDAKTLMAIMKKLGESMLGQLKTYDDPDGKDIELDGIV